MDDDNEKMISVLNELSDKFDNLCRERHEAGAKEYGVVTFLENDVVRMMAEELADTANYCRMQFIKIMMLQGFLEDELEGRADSEGNVTIGIQSFRGTGTGWSGKG